MIKYVIEPMGLLMTKGDKQEIIKVENYQAWLSQGWSLVMILWHQARKEDDLREDGNGSITWKVPEALAEVAERQIRGDRYGR